MPISRRAFVGSVASLAAAPLAARLAGVPDELEDAGGRAPAGRAPHVVVVGAGAFGGWTALALRRAGLRVTLLDAWGAGNARASSGGETRVIRAVYNGVAEYSTMVARALELWRAAERRWGRQVLFRTGVLWMCAGDDGYVRRSLTPMRAVGLRLDELAPDEAARRWPQASFADVRSVFFEPDAGILAARAACELVRASFASEGGDYRQAAARPGAERGGRLTSVTLGDGATLAADRFVFACGPWMGRLFPEEIGRRIVPTRQEVFFFGPPPGDTRWDAPALPAWIHLGERIVYGVPNHERRGVKIADDTAGEEVDPTTLERVPSTDGLARARATLGARFPALAGAPLVESRVCQYEASSDGHFLIDRHPRLENVWLVGGGSGHGFKMGPAVGEHVAALVQGAAEPKALFAWARLGPRPDPKVH